MAAIGQFLVESVLHTGFVTDSHSPDEGLSIFVNLRARLFAIAYRMLGCAAEAEDIVQDVWLRWQSTNQSAVKNPPAFLAKTTTRLCINLAQSARSRRETYFTPEFSEPADAGANPGLGAERGEALNRAILVLLQKLSPKERAAYVLRQAFDYPYRQIADILRMKEANVRQLVTRARKRISDGHSAPVGLSAQQFFLDVFVHAAKEGNVGSLENFLLQETIS